MSKNKWITIRSTEEEIATVKQCAKFKRQGAGPYLMGLHDNFRRRNASRLLQINEK
jgi:hypothetical protein